MWPQYTYLALVVLGLGFVIAKHGEPRSPHNLWVSLIATAIALSLLHAGGFFNGLL